MQILEHIFNHVVPSSTGIQGYANRAIVVLVYIHTNICTLKSKRLYIIIQDIVKRIYLVAIGALTVNYAIQFLTNYDSKEKSQTNLYSR